LLGGCLQPSSSRCGDLYCPAGTTCTPDHTRCVSPAQSSACDGKQENDVCNLPGAAAAFCIGSVCTAQVCGDSIVEGDEKCDKGAENGKCMGCSADCRSDETCGNSVIDGECAEECDDGPANADMPNAPCRTSCKRQRCGDGIVDDNSGEDCDGTPNPQASCANYGFYSGTIGCSPACRNDTTMCSGFCGDGVVNGVELCDGTPPAGQSCLDYGYDVGAIGCSRLCTPEFGGCGRLGWDNIATPF